MNAVAIHETGDPDVLTYESHPRTEPGPGQVRIKVEAAGVNFIDVYHRSGLYKVELPQVLGMEAAGVVDAISAGVAELKVGDRVAYAMQLGAYAEYVIVPAEKLVLVPDSVDLRQAAAVMLQGMTAHYLSHSTYPIQPGDTVLVHAAAGGVGRLLVQMAKRRGARVLGTASTEEKADLARSAGADAVILYSQVDFEAEVQRLTGGQGVEAVYDSVGQTTFDQSLNCLKRRGSMVLFGQSSGPVPPFNIGTLAAKGSLFLTRPTLGDYVAERSELLGRAEDLFAWMAAGELEVHIDQVFSLQDAAQAHRYLEDRKTKGKVLLVP
jgi:NADPH2:quinone reductase